MRPLALCVSILPLFLACKKGDAGASADGATPGADTAAAASPAAPAGGGGGPFGSSFEGEITMRSSSAHRPPQDITFASKGDKLRFDATGPHGDKTHTIFEPGTKKILTVMDAQKMYMEVDLAQMTARALPAPPGHDAPRATVTKTGKHEKVAGYDCEDWDIAQPGGKDADACIAQGIAFVDFGSLGPLGASAGPRGWMDELRDKKYFPLKLVEKDETGKETQRMEVTKIEKKTLDDSLFAIPAGYRKMEMPTFPAGVPGLPGHPVP